MRQCNVIRKSHVGAKYLASVGLCFVALGGAQVSAQAVPASGAFDKFMWTATGGSSQTVGFASSGQPVLTPGVPTISTDGGLPKVTATGSIQNPSGVRVPVTATGRVSGLAASALLGKALLKSVGPLAAGMALYDVANELGYIANRSNGELIFNKSRDTSTFTIRCGDSGSFINSGPASIASLASACHAHYEYVWKTQGYNSCKVFLTGITSTTFSTGATDCGRSVGLLHTPTLFQTSSIAEPKLLQDLQNDIANKSGWPSTSRIARALVESTTLTGEKLQPQTVTVTGPATSTGTTQTTTSPTTQTTKSTVHNHTYNGDTITTTSVQTTNITNISTGAVTTETQTTQNVKPEEVPDMCKANPDIVGCQKTDVPTTEVPKTTKTISWAEENLGLGNGACPAPYTFNTSNGSYSLDLAQYCDVLSTYVRPVVLAMALLAAFFIVAPVRTDV